MRSAREGTDPLPPSEHGFDRRTVMAVAGAFVLLIAPAWLEAVSSSPHLQAAIVISVAYAGGCILATPLAAHRALPTRRVWAGGLLALALALVLITGGGQSWIFILALGVTAVLLPPLDVGVLTLAAVTAVLVTAVRENTVPLRLPDVILISTTTLATALVVRLAEAHEELRRNRDDLATVAALQERTRMASDLHDLLGHSLTTLTLKAGLVRRLMAHGDLDRAAQEVLDVEELGRRALAEVRTAVTDYRTVSLVHEFALAREVLSAAGIRYDIPREAPEVATHLRVPFGHVVREGVTNVVRHSGATRVRIEVAPDRVVVQDDGCGPRGPEGNGLEGLRERLSEVGGILEIQAVGGGGCRLSAHVPSSTQEKAP